jgi:hypothetical protein
MVEKLSEFVILTLSEVEGEGSRGKVISTQLRDSSSLHSSERQDGY